MAGKLKHGFNSTLDDDPDVLLIQPSHFGSDNTDYLTDPTHVFHDGSLGALAFYDTSEVDHLGWLAAPAQGKVLVGTGLNQAPIWSFSLGPTIAPLGFDSVNGRVGIGTVTPAKGMLHVQNGGPTPASTMLPGAIVQLLSGTASGTICGVAASSSNSHLPGFYARAIRSGGTTDAPTAAGADYLIMLLEAEAMAGSPAGRVQTCNIGMFVEGISGMNVAGYINFLTGSLTSNQSAVERVRINSNGLGIGLIPAFGTGAVNVLGLRNGTAPANAPTGMVQIWAENGALKVMGGNGTITQLAAA